MAKSGENTGLIPLLACRLPAALTMNVLLLPSSTHYLYFLGQDKRMFWEPIINMSFHPRFQTVRKNVMHNVEMQIVERCYSKDILWNSHSPNLYWFIQVSHPWSVKTLLILGNVTLPSSFFLKNDGKQGLCFAAQKLQDQKFVFWQHVNAETYLHCFHLDFFLPSTLTGCLSLINFKKSQLVDVS